MAIPFAAIGGLAQAFMGMSSANTQNNLMGQQIMEARRSNRAGEKMAKASRTDAQGNKLVYIEGQGWVTEVSAIMRAILDGQNREQLATLREDAPRAREASIRKDNRSREASDEYDRLTSKRRNGPEKTEALYRAEEVVRSSESNRGTVPASVLAAAMRSGDPAAMQGAVNAARKTESSAGSRIADAQNTGSQRYFTEKSARDQIFFNELGQVRGVADNVDGAQPYMADVSGQLYGRQDQALQTLMGAMQNGSAGVQNALGNAASGWKTPDISGIFNGLESFQTQRANERAANSQQAQQQAMLAQAVYESQMMENQLKQRQMRQKLNAF